MAKARVLFVCTGNICRSPTAEAVMRKIVTDAGLRDRIECDSAGMGDWHAGRAPDPRAVRAASLRGYDMVEIRARKLSRPDFADFDLVIGMDGGHIEELKKLRPCKARGQVALFLSFSPDIASSDGADVPDPYNGSESDFEYALDLIERGISSLFAALKRDYL